MEGIRKEKRMKPAKAVELTSCASAVIRRRQTLEQVVFGTKILENVLSYLDVESIKSSRLVNHSWEEAARNVLMKRCELNVNEWGIHNEDRDDSRLSLYSTWRLRCDERRSRHFLQPSLELWGSRIKTLHITGLMSGWTTLVRTALSSWCPNLEEIHLGGGYELACPQEFEELEELCRTLDMATTADEFKNILKDSQTPGFLRSVSKLPNLHTIRMEWGSVFYKMPAFLPIFVFVFIIRSSPCLRKLILLDLEPSTGRNSIEESRFGILKHLALHPEITRRLESFTWQMNVQRDWSTPLKREMMTQPVRFVTGNSKIPPIQFANCLRVLHWDIMHVSRDGGMLLPDILDNSALTLKELSIGRTVFDQSLLNQLQMSRYKTDAHARKVWIQFNLSPVPRIRIQYPLMQNLVHMRLTAKACYSIFFDELMDAVPNLRSLEIVEEQMEEVFTAAEIDLWSGCLYSSIHHKPHMSLRFLHVGVLKWNAELVGKIAIQFPCIEELWMGHPDSCRQHADSNEIEKLVDMLEPLKYLKRFKTYMPSHLQIVTILNHIIQVQERLLGIENYQLRLTRCWRIEQHQDYIQNKGRLHKLIRMKAKKTKTRFRVSWSNRLLLGESEEYRNSPSEEALRHLISFIKYHRLPIEMLHIVDNVSY
jgi:hypothetical protein